MTWSDVMNSTKTADVTRTEMAEIIVNRLEQEAGQASATYQESKDKIGYFFVDDLLPVEIARKIHSHFPPPETMHLKKSLREFKYIAAQMNNYDPILEEAVYAFQDPRVVEAVSKICKVTGLYPDDSLYVGGLSLMGDGQFLNPHLDNSHDKDRNRWRVLNLLYYVTPDWQLENGGNLEIWPDGMDGEQITIHSKFNRLAVMATHNFSWHSVSPISCQGSNRCCVSNYYFSDVPLRGDDEFHVTSFRGRPEQPIRDIALQVDSQLRMGVRKIFKKGIVENKHGYKKE